MIYKKVHLIDDSDNEADNDSNDETVSDSIMMNPMNNSLKAKNYFNNNKSLIVYVNHAWLGFYLCLSV